MMLEYGNGAITIGSHADPALIGWPNVFDGDRERRHPPCSCAPGRPSRQPVLLPYVEQSVRAGDFQQPGHYRMWARDHQPAMPALQRPGRQDQDAHADGVQKRQPGCVNCHQLRSGIQLPRQHLTQQRSCFQRPVVAVIDRLSPWRVNCAAIARPMASNPRERH